MKNYKFDEKFCLILIKNQMNLKLSFIKCEQKTN